MSVFLTYMVDHTQEVMRMRAAVEAGRVWWGELEDRLAACPVQPVPQAEEEAAVQSRVLSGDSRYEDAVSHISVSSRHEPDADPDAALYHDAVDSLSPRPEADTSSPRQKDVNPAPSSSRDNDDDRSSGDITQAVVQHDSEVRPLAGTTITAETGHLWWAL
jgi:hypothetical protein